MMHKTTGFMPWRFFAVAVWLGAGACATFMTGCGAQRVRWGTGFSLSDPALAQKSFTDALHYAPGPASDDMTALLYLDEEEATEEEEEDFFAYEWEISVGPAYWNLSNVDESTIKNEKFAAGGYVRAYHPIGGIEGVNERTERGEDAAIAAGQPRPAGARRNVLRR